MKRILALFLCLCLCVPLIPAAFAGEIEIVDTEELSGEIVVPADEPDKTAPGPDAEIQTYAYGSCGDHLSWSLDSDGLLMIQGFGDMYNYDSGSNKAPWYEYRTEIKELYLDCESIGDYAFYGCINMTLDSVAGYELCDDITRIGNGAFLCCHGLEYVCIPSSVTEIGNYAFETCNNLKRVTVCGNPGIGALAFANCRSLEAISFLGHAPGFVGDVFSNTPRITAYYPPDDSSWTSSVRRDYGGDVSWWDEYHGWCGDDIDWKLDEESGQLSLFGSGESWRFGSRMGVYSLPSFSLLGNNTFSVYISDGVTVLNDRLFYGMYEVTEIVLPNTLTEIGEGCFEYDEFPSITIPAGVTRIGSKAFACDADDFKTIRFRGHAPEIADDAFEDAEITAYCYPVYSWHVSAGAQRDYGGTINWVCDDKIGDYVYWELDKNGKLLLYGAGETWDYEYSSSEQAPGFRFFADECVSVEMWSGIETIGENLLRDMSSLQAVYFPEDLTSIGYYAFSDCKDLKQLCFDGEAPDIHRAAFSGCKTITAYYFDGPSWTGDVMKNYGASRITWVPFGDWLKLSEEEITIPVFQTKRLKLISQHGVEVNAQWSSSDETVATVSEDGTVWAHKYGKCEITADSGKRIFFCQVQTLFTDVTDNSKYYYSPVYWAADKGITVGYTSGEYAGMFGVGQECERRQLMIFLWRYAGSPTKDKNGKAYGDARTMFNDLSDYGPSSGTNKAIAWAYKEGISKGYTDGGFHPTASIVRKDVMIMLYRLAGKPSVSGTLTWPDCKDMNPTSDTYRAILWGSQKGITNGYSSGEYAGTFGVAVNCLREQIVTFLYRYSKLK